MKWVRSNGLKLVIRDVSEPLMTFVANRSANKPLPILDEIVSDEDARETARDMKRQGFESR